MKKVVSLVITSLVTALLLMGCRGQSEKGTLELQEGVLKWDAVEGASCYEVDMGNGGETISEASYALADKCKFTGDFTVTVRSVDSKGKISDVGAMNISASQLAKPVVSIKTVGKEVYFSWTEVEGAKSYSYNAHDGKGIQVAEASEDGDYRVLITNAAKQMIDVTAHGSSEGSCVSLSQVTSYSYRSGRIFDMSMMAKYPAVYIAGGQVSESLSVGTTLKKGVYELEVSMYLMDANGNRLTGNGNWGRRIVDNDYTHYWFCEKGVEGFPESANTNPYPDIAYKETMKLRVDRGGNVIFQIYDFAVEEKIVVADITYKGKSVLNAEGGKANPLPEIKKFDVTTLDKYWAVFRSPGGMYWDAPESFVMEVPVSLSDGKHTVSIDYYVCAANGDVLEGNGEWGRRITGEDVERPLVWLNEYDLQGYPGVDIPLPTDLQTLKASVNVKDGKFKLVGLDFAAGEMIVITNVKTAKIPSGNGIFVSQGETHEVFEVETTLTGKPRHADITLEITYKVSDVFGDAVSGNGMWGRRMVVGEKHYWMCKDALDNFPQAKGTLPAANKEYTEEFFFYEINKFGILTIDMYDFLPGEMVQITSIKYNGEEVLVK